MSKKHLNRYMNEFSFGHKMKDLGTMEFIAQNIFEMLGKHFSYQQLIAI